MGLMIARLLRAIILIVLVFTAEGVFAQHTYYISNSLGLDTNTSAQATGGFCASVAAFK